MINGKKTGARLIPPHGKKAGEWVELGGLFGAAPVMPLRRPATRPSWPASGASPRPSEPDQLGLLSRGLERGGRWRAGR